MDLITAILFISGFVLLVGGAEILVRGASNLAFTIGLSPLVVGLTVVAYGTSAPELAVVLQGIYSGQGDISAGNVVGSNIANILLILGGSALVAPLIVARQLVRQDIPIMIGLSVLLLLMGLDGEIGRTEGIFLCFGGIAYTIFILLQGRQPTDDDDEIPEKISPKQRKQFVLKIALQVGYILGGLACLTVGSRWLIDGAVAAATALGVSKLIVGLTIVAIGTSLPEIATSVVAGFRDQRDIAVGNAVGSNLYNILAVLGICAALSPTGIPISPPLLTFDLPVMIAVAAACLPIFFSGYSIARWEGLLFLAYYAAYTMYLFLHAVEHDALMAYSTIMMAFVVPLTAITLIIIVLRTLHRNHRDRKAACSQDSPSAD